MRLFVTPLEGGRVELRARMEGEDGIVGDFRRELAPGVVFEGVPCEWRREHPGAHELADAQRAARAGGNTT